MERVFGRGNGRRWSGGLAALLTCALVPACAASMAQATNGVAQWGLGPQHPPPESFVHDTYLLPVEVKGVAGVRQLAGLRFALLEDGTVLSWERFPHPLSGLAGLAAIATYLPDDLYGLTGEGTVVAQGRNDKGARGAGETEEGQTPKTVTVAGISGAVSIAAGGRGGYAVLGDGTVRAWGSNDEGRLGDGSLFGPEECGSHEYCSRTPVQVAGVTDATEVVSGGYFGVARLADGSLFAWGRNEDGQLGNGNKENQSPGVAVKGVSNAIAVAAGSNHAMALLADGTVVQWGDEGGTTPKPVPGLAEVTAIADAGNTRLALLADGTVMAWGENTNGQLGDGTKISRPTPAPVQGLEHVEGISVYAQNAASFGPPLATVESVSPAAGKPSGGTSVTITGTHLDEATAVRFGETPASFTIESPTAIAAVAPPGSGLVDVHVTTHGGTPGPSAADTFDYRPRISSSSPHEGPATGGNTVIIDGTTLGEATEVRFGTKPATFKAVSETELEAVAPATANTETVPLTVVTPGGSYTTDFTDEYTFEGPPAIGKLEPKKGATTGGNEVRIEGANLSGTTSVSFGATPATGITVLDRELVIVHAPAHAPGAVHVTLSATGGETTSSLTYTYKAVAPTVTGISPAEGTALGSTLVTVSGSGFPTEPGGISFIFGKTAATNVECTSTTTCTMLAPAHPAGTVDVRGIVSGKKSKKSPADHFKYV